MYLVIDIGSNTIRAVVFCVEKGEILPVLNKKYSAGLAGYIDKDGMLSGEGVDLCLDILNEIRITIDAFSFDGVFPFATASLRNVANSEEVLRAVREEMCIRDSRRTEDLKPKRFNMTHSWRENLLRRRKSLF